MGNKTNHKRANKVKAALARNAKWAQAHPLVQRYLSRVTIVGLDTECWPWTGVLQAKEKRAMLNTGGRQAVAARIGWELFIGPLASGECVCHHCDNPSCCRPSHFFVGSHKDNMRDRDRKGRQPLGEQRPSAKLTEIDVRSILGSAQSNKSLAEIYAVDPSRISAIRHRRAWRHLHEETTL